MSLFTGRGRRREGKSLGTRGPKGESSSSFGSNIMNVPLFGFYVDLKSQNQGGKVTKLKIMYLLTKIFRGIKKANFK